ncbi:SLC13 family permease [uncultured Acidaminococcus sp.]|uniref:SLC13 family permease n=1 Tax=uncultured Acidaminococcus sp. TaxID=352152 RepID=UPI00260A2C16|nr:SLC13 family permease [uncultured Acidaminococcus sp.]
MKFFFHTLLWIRSNTILFLASLGALLSFLVVPPSWALVGALNLPVLALLFCLMGVIGGLRETGFFDRILDHLLDRLSNTRQLGAVLVFACFFGSMWVTNDVALITFVPFALLSLEGQVTEKHTGRIIVLQTLAANLGSMVTPVGNPQNLYLYFHYQMDLGGFLALLLPYTLVSLGMLALGVVLWVPGRPLEKRRRGVNGKGSNGKYGKILGILFCLCLLTVAHLLDWRMTLGAVTMGILATRPRWFRWVDYRLLGTFVAFFVLIGNLGQVPAFRQLLISFLDGREFLTALLASQVISNVPAAVLLSGFTDNGRALVLGTDIGGLGTLIASMASLISYGFYVRRYPWLQGYYLKAFTLANLTFLVPLVGMTVL